MKELIGQCTSCLKEIYCLDGFFNGVQTEDHKIYCFECFESNKEENPQSQTLRIFYFLLIFFNR